MLWFKYEFCRSIDSPKHSLFIIFFLCRRAKSLMKSWSSLRKLHLIFLAKSRAGPVQKLRSVFCWTMELSFLNLWCFYLFLNSPSCLLFFQPAAQPQNRYSETDNRDWHTRAPIPSPSKDRSREDQRQSKDSYAGSNQGVSVDFWQCLGLLLGLSLL